PATPHRLPPRSAQVGSRPGRGGPRRRPCPPGSDAAASCSPRRGGTEAGLRGAWPRARSRKAPAPFRRGCARPDLPWRVSAAPSPGRCWSRRRARRPALRAAAKLPPWEPISARRAGGHFLVGPARAREGSGRGRGGAGRGGALGPAALTASVPRAAESGRRSLEALGLPITQKETLGASAVQADWATGWLFSLGSLGVTAPGSEMSKPPPKPVKPGQVKVFRALYTFEPRTPDELYFEEGDIIYITDMSDTNWWKGTCKGRTGLIPSNYVAEQAESIDNPLHEAAKRGNLSWLRECLDNRVGVNGLDKAGSTALYWACHGGHKDIVEVLFTQPNIELNQQNKLGDTALHAAAWKGYADIVQLLLAKGKVYADFIWSLLTLKNVLHQRALYFIYFSFS
uniref:Osteoclast-stimulating factor 1 n=1 Tax=Oryctolagus cuniculus TaxID=9986 RepID=A0A5F9DC90_RABIT